MKIYMIINVMATLLVTPKQPTTFQFEHPIEYYSLGNADSFDTYLSKNSKVLLIKSKKDQFDEILVVITKNHSYEFRLKSYEEKITALYQIKHAQTEKFLTRKVDAKSFQVLEGRNILKITRKGNGHLVINGLKVFKKSTYYPKRAYLRINGRVIP